MQGDATDFRVGQNSLTCQGRATEASFFYQGVPRDPLHIRLCVVYVHLLLETSTDLVHESLCL